MATPRPFVQIPDEIEPEKNGTYLRMVFDNLSKAIADVERRTRIAEEPAATRRRLRESPGERVANKLYAMGGGVSLDKARMGQNGDVLYLIDGGRSAVWGNATTPAPTGGGTGPSVGAPHNLLDGVQDQDTVVAACVRGSIIRGNSTPKWSRLDSPASASVLTHDTSDPSWTAKVATRSALIPAITFDTSGASAAYNVVGTPPDFYECWEFPSTGTADVTTIFRVPYDYLSGTVSVVAHWATTGATNTNWVPKVVNLALAAGTAFTAAGSTITGPATSCNFATDVMQSTVVGTFTPSGGAGSLVRIGLRRVPGGSDTYLGTIRMAALEIDYTAAY